MRHTDYGKEKKFCRLCAVVLVVGLTLGLLAPTAGAEVVSDPTGLGIGFSAVLYDNSNGLPTSEANAIVQSADGFIWIGSYSGLIRYDGNVFERYDASSGISSVVSLFADSRGRIWVGTNDSGAACLQGQTFVFYDRAQGLRSSSVRSIVEDPDGNIIIATTMGVAYVDTDGKLSVIDDAMVNTQYVCELVASAGGLIYAVTLSGDVFTIENCRVGHYYSGERMGVGLINTIFPDPEKPGWVYLGMQDSTVYYGDLSVEMSGAAKLSAEPQKTINAIRLISGMIWICADNGIGYFDRNRRYVQVLDVPMTNSVDHMLVDYEENLWFTSSRQGVMKIVENRFTDISALAGLDTMVVNTTCLSRGLLYVGTDSGLVILDQDYQRVENDLTAQLAGARIRCIRRDSAGRLWFGTYSVNGLVCYDPSAGTWKTYTTENGLAADRARMMTELSDGRIAVATNAGMNLITDGAVTATFDGRNGISNLEILCIEEGSDGRIYLGSDGDGIYVVDGTKVSRLGVDDGLRSEVILRLKKDPSEDLYWIVTSNSISYMRADNRITTLHHFPYSNNFDLFFDENGRVWILSSNGIYVVSREDLLSDKPLTYTLYDTRSGMSRVATANSYSDIEPDGTLYIACSTGVSRVNINENAESNSRVRLGVPFLMADNRYIANDGTGAIRVPADCRRLHIYAMAFTYKLQNPRLSYYLEGFDDGPIETTKQDLSSISYTNLAGGTYRFHLSLFNTLTGEIDQTLTLTFVKEKAYYEQIWFWALLVAAGVALIVGVALFFFRRHTKKLIAKQQETKRLVDEMTSAFADCIDMKDAYTNGHSARVAKYSAMLAGALGKSEEEVEHIRNIALLHDIGKISIPDNILNKPGRLTDEEFAVMKSHSARGYEILKKIQIAPDLALGAGYHHERIDGRGYPRGVDGGEIPEVAQIIAVADTFDAMYSDRPYRKKMKLSDVEAEIVRVEGTQLSPRVVEAFRKLVAEGAFDNI
ncbi:MAG: HD domain-containing protein [Eubacteriales bacterium]|nr:HD domain-containing protein [Eubacteriales bacterium]